MAGNKFWGGDASSSESDSDSSSDEEKQVAAANAPARKQMARWAEESSSEEEVSAKRTVRSHTDKRYDQMNQMIKLLKNHMKIDDFATLITDYETVVKMLVKLKTVVDQDGGPPNNFVKVINNLEEYVEKMHAELQEKKANKGEKLSENKAKAFNTLRAKVRKGNRAFQEHLDRLKEHPEEFEGQEEAEDKKDDSDSDSEPGEAASSSSSSDSSGSDSDSDSSSDSDSDTGGSDSDSSKSDKSDNGTTDSDVEDGDTDALRERKMLRWLITPEKLASREKEAATKNAKDEEIKTREQVKLARKKDESGDKKGKDVSGKDKKQDEKEEYTPDELMKKVTDIAQQRGRRGFDRKAYMEKLQNLMAHAAKQSPQAQLFILASMVSADFDNTGSAFAAMRIDMWNEALAKVNQMLPLLLESWKENKESIPDEKAAAAAGEEDDPRSHTRLTELFVAFVEKLDDELYKALQFCVDVYGDEFTHILGNSSKCLILLQRTLKFFEETGQSSQQLGVVAARLLEQLYYKHDVLNASVYEAIRFNMSDVEKPQWDWAQDSKAFMGKLSHYVWETGNQRLQRRACLCQAYHLALHDCFQPARDLLHLGNFQEQSLEADVHTQILYNRVVAQMGLCAFRLGKIQESHNCLMDICQYNKVRELLAQGLSYSKNMERTPEQERAERQRQLPYHMHVNLEVLESAHHISAMLLEVPNMAMQSIDPNNKRVISRQLRRSLDQFDKQLFSGPPENAKESVVASAKALQRGDWAFSVASLEDLKLWEHIDPRGLEEGNKVKDMIKEKIKTEALRTYMFSYASIYDAFHLDQLVAMFDLPPRSVHSVISKMIIKEEITAFWDESSKFVLVQHVEPSHLQRLALALADRGNQAVENNERLVDQRSGGYAFKEGRGKGEGGGGRWEQGGKGKDSKGGKGGGKGKKGSKGTTVQGPPKMRGWENARSGALRGGTGQRGWSTGVKA